MSNCLALTMPEAPDKWNRSPLYLRALALGKPYFVKTPWWLKKIYPHRIWNRDRNERTIYLTFDDGPHPTITPFVLAQLKRHKSKATFFCIGKNVVDHLPNDWRAPGQRCSPADTWAATDCHVGGADFRSRRVARVRRFSREPGPVSCAPLMRRAGSPTNFALPDEG